MTKQIDQLAVIKELNALVCLSAGDLTLHSLPDLSLLSSFAPQTRGGGSTFALHTEIRHEPAASATPQPPPPTIRTTLALACKRRLILLSWVDGTTWNPLVELALPHQIRGMAFVDAADSSSDPTTNGSNSDGGATKLVAGFSTGEYGIVTLPTPDVKGAIKAPSLGDLFSPPIPLSEPKPAASARTGLTTGLSGLRNISGALGGALGGRKLDKNGVAKVPRVPRRAVRRGVQGVDEKEDEVLQRWLWEKEWGWTDAQREEGEVLVMRDSESAAGSYRAAHWTDAVLRRLGHTTFGRRSTKAGREDIPAQPDHITAGIGRRGARVASLHPLACRLCASCKHRQRFLNATARSITALHPRCPHPVRLVAGPVTRRAAGSTLTTRFNRSIFTRRSSGLYRIASAGLYRSLAHLVEHDTETAPIDPHLQVCVVAERAGIARGWSGTDALGCDDGELAETDRGAR